MLNLKRLLERLLKRKPPEETPEEPVANNMYDFLLYVESEYAKAYIDCFCPWVDYDSLSEEDKKRFARLSAMTQINVEGWCSITFDPLDLEEFSDLIPEPTPEELMAYIESFSISDEEKAEIRAIIISELVTEPTPQ